jgi:Ca2+-binding RTX toxin-like protein
MRVRASGRHPARILAAAVGLGVWSIPVTAGAAPPPNDAFAARTTVAAIPYDDAQSTVEATTEPGEPESPCGPVGKSVWYQFTPAADVVLRADTLGSDFDTILAVWAGGDLASLSRVACSDDLFNSQSIVVFAAEAGTTYVFQVGGFDDSAGALSFHLRPVDAGTISGTVTDEATGAPLADVCVDVIDADFFSFNTTVTDAAGEYRVPVRSGSYKAVFYDWCDERNDHRTEWYVGKADIVSADEIPVMAPAVTDGIDASLVPSCPGFGDFPFPQLIGTPGADTLVGGPEPEILCGFGGNDRIRGGGARDRILGGQGEDRLSGGPGSDYVWGGPGDDRLGGGSDKDFCNGGPGEDRANRSCERARNIP